LSIKNAEDGINLDNLKKNEKKIIDGFKNLNRLVGRKKVYYYLYVKDIVLKMKMQQEKTKIIVSLR
jgi:hypothetical protein